MATRAFWKTATRGSIGDELLKVHVSYGPLVQALVKKFNKAESGTGKAERKDEG